jgi:hypothetical protein
LALGNSGTGKTHIGLALGLAACQQGFRVRFTTAASLVHELIEARDEKRLLRYQKGILRNEAVPLAEKQLGIGNCASSWQRKQPGSSVWPRLFG